MAAACANVVLASTALRFTHSQKIEFGICSAVAIAVVVLSIGVHTYTHLEMNTPSAKQTRYAEEASYLDKDITYMWGREDEKEGERDTLDTHTVNTRARTAWRR